MFETKQLRYLTNSLKVGGGANFILMNSGFLVKFISGFNGYLMDNNDLMITSMLKSI